MDAHQIAGGKAEVAGLPGAMTRAEACAVCPTHLAHAMARRRDHERHKARAPQDWGRIRAHTGRIEPLRIGQPALGAIPLRPSTRPHLDRQPGRLQAAVERPAPGSDRGGIPQRLLGLRFDLGLAKRSGGLQAFGARARLTR